MLRSGSRQKVLIFDVVVGDIVILSIGDIIPADGLFVDGKIPLTLSLIIVTKGLILMDACSQDMGSWSTNQQ